MPPRARHNYSSAAVVRPISPAASRWRLGLLAAAAWHRSPLVCLATQRTSRPVAARRFFPAADPASFFPAADPASTGGPAARQRFCRERFCRSSGVGGCFCCFCRQRFCRFCRHGWAAGAAHGCAPAVVTGAAFSFRNPFLPRALQAPFFWVCFAFRRQAPLRACAGAALNRRFRRGPVSDSERVSLRCGSAPRTGAAQGGSAAPPVRTPAHASASRISCYLMNLLQRQVSC